MTHGRKTGGLAAMPPTTHAHCFVPGADRAVAPLVLLHGSGGNEFDLMPLAEALAPQAAKLGIRGTVAIDAGYAFFQRFPDRRINQPDIAARAPVLADFIAATCSRYGIGARPIAVGFSNGAIMAAALLLTRPDLLAAAVLLRPLSPFSDDPARTLDSTPVLIIDGDKDDRRAQGDGKRLAERLVHAGAQVAHHVLPTGHAITAQDRHIAGDWLQTITG